MYGSNYGRATEVSIVELRLQETGTFNNQYHRPFEALFDTSPWKTSRAVSSQRSVPLDPVVLTTR